MAVFWKKQSLKKLNESKREKQTQKDEIAEIQDALVEIAGLVEEMAAKVTGKEGEDNG